MTANNAENNVETASKPIAPEGYCMQCGKRRSLCQGHIAQEYLFT